MPMQCLIKIKKADLIFVVIRKREQRTRQRESPAAINSWGVCGVCSSDVSNTKKVE